MRDTEPGSSASRDLIALDEFLALVRPRCPRLVMDPLVDRLGEIPAAREPIWHSAALEVHPDGRCDLMGELGPTSRLSPAIAAHPYFASLALAAPWASAAPPRDKVAWFEFDCAPGAPLVAYEMISVDPSVLGRWRGGAPESAVATRASLDEAMALLEVTDRHAYATATARLVDELGAAGRLLHLGNLQRRSGGGLRLCAFVEVSQLCGWLRRIGWSGELRGLGHLLGSLAPVGLALGVQIELQPSTDGVRVGPYLGIESPAVYSDVDPREADATLRGWGSLVPELGDQLAPLRGWLETSGAHWRHAIYCKFVWSAGTVLAKRYLALVPHV